MAGFIDALAVAPRRAGSVVLTVKSTVVGRVTPMTVALERVHGRPRVGQQVGQAVFQQVLVDVDLLVGLGVHEDVIVAVGIEVLHFLRLDGHPLYPVGGAQPFFHLATAGEVAHRRLHGPAHVAGRHVMRLHDAKQGAVDLQNHP